MSQMAFLLFREAIEFLRKFGRDVRDDQGVIAFVFQFKHVTDPMNLGDQGRLIRWDAEPRAQPP